jgi:hypothetical protein
VLQFFHEDVALAMEHYRDKEGVEELTDCDSTVKFIRKMHKLIKAMNSSNAWDSLRSSEENETRKVRVLQENKCIIKHHSTKNVNRP